MPYQLAEGAKEPFAFRLLAEGKPLAPAPGDVVTVRSSNPAAVKVTLDSAPVEGAIASGTMTGGSTPTNEVSIQCTLHRASGTQTHAVIIVDVAGGVPPPPKPVPPPPPPVLQGVVGWQKPAAPPVAAPPPPPKPVVAPPEPPKAPEPPKVGA